MGYRIVGSCSDGWFQTSTALAVSSSSGSGSPDGLNDRLDPPKMRVSIASPPDREDLVAETFFGDEKWAETNRESGTVALELHTQGPESRGFSPTMRRWRRLRKLVVDCVRNEDAVDDALLRSPRKAA